MVGGPIQKQSRRARDVSGWSQDWSHGHEQPTVLHRTDGQRSEDPTPPRHPQPPAAKAPNGGGGGPSGMCQTTPSQSIFFSPRAKNGRMGTILGWGGHRLWGWW